MARCVCVGGGLSSFNTELAVGSSFLKINDFDDFSHFPDYSEVEVTTNIISFFPGKANYIKILFYKNTSEPAPPPSENGGSLYCPPFSSS